MAVRADDVFVCGAPSAALGRRPDWQRKSPLIKRYEASYTCTLFHLDRSVVRGLMGPLGSGKSTACCAEVMSLAMAMPVLSNGKRQARVAIIRNTYRELADSTINTWLDWFPEAQFGDFNRGDNTHQIRILCTDGAPLELDVVFRALDRPADVKKLLSVEYSFAWVNEAREIPLVIINMLRDRVGRFPSYGDPVLKAAAARAYAAGLTQEQLGEVNMAEYGGYWAGVIMDTNPPDEDHWWYKIFELGGVDVSQQTGYSPSGWRLFRQPSGRSPQAENLANLRPGYYQNMAGKTPEWVKIYYDGGYGFVSDGRPVYPEWTDGFHCTDWAVPLKGIEIRVGIDFGLTPAAVFVQQDIHGRWRVIDELVADGMGITRFAELLNQKIQAEYAGYQFKFFGDPAGDQRAQTDENTPFKILRANEIQAFPARTNDFNIRREAVAQPLMRIIDGRPGLSIHPKCRQLRKGMGGKYCYRRVQIVGDDRFHDKPDKGMYSHVSEALQYVMLEFGSNPTMSKTQQQVGSVMFTAPQDWSPFNSQGMLPLPFSHILVPEALHAEVQTDRKRRRGDQPAAAEGWEARGRPGGYRRDPGWRVLLPS